MPISKVQLFSIPVADQDASLAFYVGVLGFELVADQPMGPGMRWVQLSIPGTETSVTLVTWFESMPAGSLRGLVLECDDLEGDVALLRERGAQIDDEIQSMPWGRFVALSDPDGNGLILQTTA